MNNHDLKAIQAANHGTYGASLLDVRWKAKRATILARDAHRCRVCGAVEQLQVHHRQYFFYPALQRFANPWEYPDHLLVSLCQQCHLRGHRQYTVPVVVIR